jgi:2-keto-4-pentenoate hydratase/2-oxohepta-3-ene-1,7-dioic acid hydratase in catechol pathway
MQIARVLDGDEARWCILEGGDAHVLEGDRFASPGKGRSLGALEQLKILRPIEPLNKVIGLWSTWRAKEERDGPGFFIKSPSTLINPGEPIVYPEIGVRVVYEAELAIVIGRRCRSVAVEEARDYVMGYSCFNDVTALEISVNTVVEQLGIGLQFQCGKAFDTFGVMGPCISTSADGDNAALRAWVNGELITDTNTSRMLWHTEEIVSFVSRFMTLEPGDVISCGTPLEFASIAPGDEVQIAIEGIGTLANPVTK